MSIPAAIEFHMGALYIRFVGNFGEKV